MKQIPFAKFLECSPFILGEGAVIERLRRNGDLALDPRLREWGEYTPEHLPRYPIIEERVKRPVLENEKPVFKDRPEWRLIFRSENHTALTILDTVAVPPMYRITNEPDSRATPTKPIGLKRSPKISHANIVATSGSSNVLMLATIDQHLESVRMIAHYIEYCYH